MTATRRTKNAGLSGFVYLMKQRDAEAALCELDGFDWGVIGPRAACEQAVEQLKAQIKPPPAEAITATLSVPLKYHHAVAQQGNVFLTLRSFGVQVEHSAHPQKPAVPPHPAAQADASDARIDDLDEEAAIPEAKWQVVPNYQDSDAKEGESEWTFKARDQTGSDQALKLTKDAIEHAKMSRVGFLTLPDRSLFPRIVGAKGSNVARLRSESGADITASREDNTMDPSLLFRLQRMLY